MYRGRYHQAWREAQPAGQRRVRNGPRLDPRPQLSGSLVRLPLRYVQCRQAPRRRRPPPLRGTNYKDIRGLPGVKGEDLARVTSANKLLERMNLLMKSCVSVGLPFYLENPLRSKLWIHPLSKSGYDTSTRRQYSSISVNTGNLG